MAIVVESVATGQSPITKPSGLAVGDLMVAVVGGTLNKTATTPSGWTSHVGNSGGGFARAIFSKVADSSDVAASNFTFDDSNPSAMAGTLYRITGYVDNSTISFLTFAADDSSGDANIVVATGMTPEHVSSILIVAAVADRDGGSFSNYSLGVSASFTERYDGSPSYRCNLACVDSILSTTSALGNFTAQFGFTTLLGNGSGILIYEKVDATANPTHLSIPAPHIYQTIPQMIRATPTVYPCTPVLVTPTWTNEDKHAATGVTNIDKS